jgi:hypothetical protein
VLTLDENWAHGHPRTMFLLNEEVQAWSGREGLRLRVETV